MGDKTFSNNVTLNGNTSVSSLSFDGAAMAGHILPTQNAQFDIGSAEYKVRHLFLSDNSLWIGDQHKLSIKGGKFSARKRKKNNTFIPASIVAAGGNADAAKAAGVSSLADMTIDKWVGYARTLNVGGRGIGKADVMDIFNDNDDDFEEEFTTDGITAQPDEINVLSGAGGITPNKAVIYNGDGKIMGREQENNLILQH